MGNGGRHEINLPEFPDVTFRWTYGEMMAVTGNEITSLYRGSVSDTTVIKEGKLFNSGVSKDKLVSWVNDLGL